MVVRRCVRWAYVLVAEEMVSVIVKSVVESEFFSINLFSINFSMPGKIYF